MKQKIYNISLYLLVAVIFLGGSGFTVVNFCCSSCIESFFSDVSFEKTCAHQDEKLTQKSCCSDLQQASAIINNVFFDSDGNICCGAERVSFDIDLRFYKPDVSSHSLSMTIPFTSGFLCHINKPTIHNNRLSFPLKDAIPINPREYLSIIRILTI